MFLYTFLNFQHAFLCAIDETVWDSVVIGWVSPTTPKAKWDKATLALANANSKTINAIFYGVSTNEFHRISHVKTAQKAWKILETTYEGTKKVKDTKLQMLTTRFDKVKTSEDESFDSFYGRLNEIVIYNYVFYVGFNCVSNLIIFLFNHFPVFLVGFNVRVVCESLVKICEKGDFAIGS